MKSHKTAFLLYSFLVLIVALSSSCKEIIRSEDNHEILSSRRQGENEWSDTAVLNSHEKNTIYKIGKTVKDYEDNFLNLFENWRTQNISNANNYKLTSFSFLETISDSLIYRKYRNYFTGDKPVGSQINSSSKSSSNGKKQSLLFVYPVKRYQFLYDTTDSLYKSPDWMNKEFKTQALDVLKADFNIDTAKILHHKFKENKIFSTYETFPFIISSTAKLTQSFEKFSIDNLSQNYIDVVLKGETNYEQLKTSEKRRLAIEELVINKITDQIIFTNTIEIGDVVYLIKMEYDDKYYELYVICDRDNKQVIWDPFFKNIAI